MNTKDPREMVLDMHQEAKRQGIEIRFIEFQQESGTSIGCKPEKVVIITSTLCKKEQN